MTTPTERKALELTQGIMTALDELYDLSGLTTGAMLVLGYNEDSDETTLLSMRYVTGRVEPVELLGPEVVDAAKVIHLKDKPELSIVPKE